MICVDSLDKGSISDDELILSQVHVGVASTADIVVNWLISFQYFLNHNKYVLKQ